MFWKQQKQQQNTYSAGCLTISPSVSLTSLQLIKINLEAIVTYYTSYKKWCMRTTKAAYVSKKYNMQYQKKILQTNPTDAYKN